MRLLILVIMFLMPYVPGSLAFAQDKPSRLTRNLIIDGDQFYSLSTIPQHDHTLAVPVMLNQKISSIFLIDTGASYTVITPGLAKKLGIIVKNSENVIPLNTANGMTFAPVAKISLIKLGKMNVRDVEVIVTDLGLSGEVSGLLGMSFFAGKSLLITPDRLFVGQKDN